MFSSNPPQINRASLDACKEHFLQINAARLQRTLSSLTPRQQSCLLTIPVLLHINHPLLPGYVSQNTPAGIIHFQPSEQQIRIVENLARSLDLQNRTVESFSILHLSFMGSCGTIAQNKQSDLDFWVCYDPKLSDTAIQELKQKLIAIERWAEEVDLEVHFFPMNAEQFKQGERNEMSGEDCGSAQHYLLLDEFYRTAVMLGGQYPLWWWVSIEYESHYEAYTNTLFDQKIIERNEVIDLGNITTIPAGEFIGAGMWQLYKAIDSPYKSVIKILLAEIYANAYPNIDCLSHHFKKNVYNGVTSLNELDPYLMLYQTIENYLIAQQDNERLELARRCFYFKTNERLSQKPSSYSLEWRRVLLEPLINTWGWTSQHLSLLDDHDQWNALQASQENKILTDALSQSYEILSQFAKNHPDSILINEKDMRVLNNKLSAAFERKPNKIERMCSSLSKHLLEEHLTLVFSTDANTKEPMWSLYSGNLHKHILVEHIPIRECSNLVELLAWCYYNQLIDIHTHVHLHAHTSSLREKELSGIVQHLSTHYSNTALAYQPDDFNQVAFPKKISWFINVDSLLFFDNSKYGLSTISNNIDVLNYSVQAKNLVLSIDKLSANTWGEVSTARFDEKSFEQSHVVALSILHVLNELPKNQEQPLPKIEVLCFTSARSEAIVRRLNTLITELTKSFYSKPEGKQSRYILRIAKSFYVFYFQDNQPKFKKLNGENQLIKFLSIPKLIPSPIIFDQYALPDHPLSLISAHYKENEIQIFYCKKINTLDIYLLDQYSNLIQFSVQLREVASYLAHLARFIYLILRRQFKSLLENQEIIPIHYYEVITNKNERPRLVQKSIRPNAASVKYYEVRFSIEPQENGEHHYTIVCGQKVFSHNEQGANLFKVVAQHILSIRTDTTPYPIYITDLTIKSPLQVPLSLTQYVQLKLALEDRLNQAVKM